MSISDSRRRIPHGRQRRPNIWLAYVGVNNEGVILTLGVVDPRGRLQRSPQGLTTRMILAQD
ncbi:MAG: hypothetical protein ACREOG_04820 [Gemmatimonadaceae bacterium]